MATSTAKPKYTAIFLNPLSVFLLQPDELGPSTSNGKLLTFIKSTSAWEGHERQIVPDVYSRIAMEVGGGATPPKVRELVNFSRDSATLDEALLNALQLVKASVNSEIRLFAVADVSQSQWSMYRNRSDLEPLWNAFDGAFPSFKIGARTTDPEYFKHVLQHTNVNPSEAVFIDGSNESVMLAKTLGMSAFVLDDPRDAIRTVKNVLGDSSKRGWEFLYKHAKEAQSNTESGMVIHDHLSELLVLQATGNDDLVTFTRIPTSDPWTFFKQDMQYPFEVNEEDVEISALATLLWLPALLGNHVVLGRISQVFNADGIVPMSLSIPDQSEIDPVVCVNVLRLFYRHRRIDEVKKTFRWVEEVLRHEAYLNGTRRYQQPDFFLYFLTCLVTEDPNGEELVALRNVLVKHVKARIGSAEDVLGMSLNIISCKTLGIDNLRDLERLKNLQCIDGGWEASCVANYGHPRMTYRNRQVTTAFAVKAIDALMRSTSGKTAESTVTTKILCSSVIPEAGTTNPVFPDPKKVPAEPFSHKTTNSRCQQPRISMLQVFKLFVSIKAIQLLRYLETTTVSALAGLIFWGVLLVEHPVEAFADHAEPYLAWTVESTIGVKAALSPTKVKKTFHEYVTSPVKMSIATRVERLGDSIVAVGERVKSTATPQKPKSNDRDQNSIGGTPETSQVTANRVDIK